MCSSSMCVRADKSLRCHCLLLVRRVDIMDRVQVNLTCVLLNMMFTLITAQLLPRTRCQPCQAGYFVEKNCSVQDPNNKWKEGVRCKECTDCSAAGQVTLVKCSTFVDSLCGNQSTDFKSTASAPDVWTALIVIVLLLFLILLLTLCLILMYRRKHHKKLKGMDHL